MVKTGKGVKTVISVIIPTYNRARLLGECLASVCEQTWADKEVIVVDDGSDDETREIVKSFSHIRYLQCGHSGFPGIPRNTGAAEAQGDWLAFLDSDDVWKPDKLSAQYEYISGLERAGETCRLVHTREIWDRCGTTISQKGQKHRRSGDVFADALKKCMIGPSTVMMRKDTFFELGGFDETLEIAEDYELWLRVTDRYPVHYLDIPLTVKRAGDWDQLSAKYGQIEVFRIQALEKLAAGYPWASPDHERMAREELMRKYRIYMKGLEKRGKSAEFAVYEAKLHNLRNR
ncbi:MAG: glycosyltransferase family 2 protein [Spirochaetales bacterium]|nr:glycosyltransferase family 2 protein [Spirochaetales bacterium]